MGDFIINFLFKVFAAWLGYNVALWFFKGMTPAQIAAAFVAMYFFAESSVTFKP